MKPKNGFIMNMGNVALKQQLEYSGEELHTKVLEELSTAAEIYYRYDSNLEAKKNAISILKYILENEREDLKTILNEEYDIP